MHRWIARRFVTWYLVICVLCVGQLSCDASAPIDWALQASDGTRLHDYSTGWPEGRMISVQTVDVRTFGSVFDGGHGLLTSAADLTVDTDGNVFVLDSDAQAVVKFDRAGEYVNAFGRRGQGPGEFVAPERIAVVGGDVCVFDRAKNRLSIWSRTGNFIREIDNPVEREIIGFEGVADTLIIGTLRIRDAGVYSVYIRAVNITGGSIRTLGTFPVHGISLVPRRLSAAFVSGFNLGIAGGRIGRPGFAVSRGAGVVINPGDNPEIAELSVTGTTKWIVRMPMARRRFDQLEIDRLTRPKKAGKELVAADLQVPQLAPSLSYIQVDGRGNVFVAPYPADGTVGGGEGLPSYVFSSEGVFLGEAYMQVRDWAAAWQEFIYTIESNAQTSEREIVQRRVTLRANGLGSD